MLSAVGSAAAEWAMGRQSGAKGRARRGSHNPVELNETVTSIRSRCTLLISQVFLKPCHELGNGAVSMFSAKTMSGSFKDDQLAGNIRRLKFCLNLLTVFHRHEFVFVSDNQQ